MVKRESSEKKKSQMIVLKKHVIGDCMYGGAVGCLKPEPVSLRQVNLRWYLEPRCFWSLGGSWRLFQRGYNRKIPNFLRVLDEKQKKALARLGRISEGSSSLC